MKKPLFLTRHDKKASKLARIKRIQTGEHLPGPLQINTGRWTDTEHKKFLEGILLFGNDWKNVQDMIGTRTSTQARSHAQKFFIYLRNKLKIKSENKNKNKKSSDCNSILNEAITKIIKDNLHNKYSDDFLQEKNGLLIKMIIGFQRSCGRSKPNIANSDSEDMEKIDYRKRQGKALFEVRKVSRDSDVIYHSEPINVNEEIKEKSIFDENDNYDFDSSKIKSEINDDCNETINEYNNNFPVNNMFITDDYANNMMCPDSFFTNVNASKLFNQDLSSNQEAFGLLKSFFINEQPRVNKFDFLIKKRSFKKPTPEEILMEYFKKDINYNITNYTNYQNAQLEGMNLFLNKIDHPNTMSYTEFLNN